MAAGHVRRGRYVLDYGSSSIDTSWPYLRPPGQQQARFEDVSLELLTVDPTHFATQAAVHLAGTGAVLRPVAAERAGPISQEAASLWHSTADHVATAAADLTLFELPLVRATLLDLSVMTLLRAFPLASDPDFMTGIDAHPRALRRALQYMEDHVGDPITVPMIADAARLSVRSLQNGFTRHLGTTPMRHLRRLRLHAAHDQLIAADPDGGLTVEHIARRWGFTHLGRFAGAYREAFGTLPSIDLRR